MLNIEKQLQKLEEQLTQPAFRHDRQVASSLLADEFREFGSSGRIWDKEQALDSLRNEASARFSVADFEAAVLCPGIALVTYRAVRHSLASGENSTSLRSSLWIWRDGRWQMLFHQGTPVTNQNPL